jgi:DNA-binding PadR family transcriptional regulator
MRNGTKVRRGEVRSAILALLTEEPMHGYQVIQELSERSRGLWRPSAGSIYPTLQQLDDEGLAHAEERDGRRVFSLTDAGRDEAANLPAKSHTPWEVAGADENDELSGLLVQVAAATMQVGQVGSLRIIGRAVDILRDSRRQLYGLLSDDEAEEG